MGKGKIAAQCCHATLGVIDTIRKRGAESQVRFWKRIGAAKVVVKLPNEEALQRVHQKAQALGLPTYVVQDAGRTQIAAGSRTVVAVGPGPVDIVDQVTKEFSLM